MRAIIDHDSSICSHQQTNRCAHLSLALIARANPAPGKPRNHLRSNLRLLFLLLPAQFSWEDAQTNKAATTEGRERSREAGPNLTENNRTRQGWRPAARAHCASNRRLLTSSQAATSAKQPPAATIRAAFNATATMLDWLTWLFTINFSIVYSFANQHRSISPSSFGKQRQQQFLGPKEAFEYFNVNPTFCWLSERDHKSALAPVN